MRGISVVRRLCRRNDRPHGAIFSSVNGTQRISSPSPSTASYSSLNPTHEPPRLVNSTTVPKFEASQRFSRYFCSSSSGPSNIVLIESEEQLNSSLRKVQGRLISPIIGQLSDKFPHVTTYKIDIDQESLGRVLSELNITSVPTLYFFKDGKKVSEVIGADVNRLKDTMEKLYK
ncbi:hypothetical protein RJ640_000309 [Escallonia rubra]|uniref:Thioredoxin domain-containing protein n=1 Tax=Escallonia rubra TaxID=112253 RepID=A0AA88UU58_9ASTE|nr:hypothetical protein RJ640_000309 [Escallonia rubra]